MNEQIVRLGAAVKRRRAEKGWTQRDVTQAGGPSDTTQTGIETGNVKAVSAATLRKLETALHWQSGSAKAAMDGGEPVVLDEPEEQRHAATNHVDTIVYLAAQITELSADINEMVNQHDDLREIAKRSDALARYAALAALSELVGSDVRARPSSTPVRPGDPDWMSNELNAMSKGSLERVLGTLAEAIRDVSPDYSPEEDEHVDGMASQKGRSSNG